MDDTGQVRSIVDPDSHPVTNFTYQCSGALPYQVTNALSQTTTYGYDCNSGQITKVQDPNDLAAGRSGTTYSYESGAGRLQAVNYPDGGQTSYSYPSTTEVDTSVLASPNPAVSSQDVVDSFGRKYQHVQAGISSETTYDVNGRVDCVTNPHFTASSSSTDGTTCVTTYDGLDRPKVQTGTDGSTQSWSYAGNVTTSIDEAGHSWKRTSDALGRLISVIEPTGASTNYVYDALNNLHTVSQTGVSGDTARTRSFVYDSLSRLTSSTNPETGTIGYGYDANGNLTSKTDARGITTTYGYDALNRLTYKHYSDGTLPAAFGYDGKDESGGAVSTPVSNAIGRVSHTSNQTNAAANYSYDSMGRLNHEYYCVPSNCSYGIQVGATYDLAGNTSSLIYPDGRVISQNMDAAGRIASVNYASWNGNAHSGAYINASAAGSYDPAGHLVSATFGNAIGLAASYDKRERVDMLAYGTAAQLLWGKQYQWSANSNLQMITDALTGTQRQFGYDNLNRITSAEDIVGSSQGANTTPFATGSGDTVVGSSSGATPTPSWTDPDDSNILLNPDVPGSTGWEVASSNITTGVLAPDGTATAASFTASSGSTDSYLGAIAAQSSLYDGETMTGSVWLRAPNGTQNVNLYLVEDGTAGYSIPASKSVTVTTTWQQFQLSGKFQYGHTTLIFQIGGAGSVQSGQTISVWGSKLEDTGTSGPTITNFVRYSQRLTASTWGVQAGVAVDNAATAPDGTNTAATVTANSGSSDSWIVDNVPNPAPFSGVPITGSVWLRAPGGPQNISITLIEVGANGYSAFGGGTVSLTTGWQRFQMTGTTQSTLTVLQLQIGGAGTFTNGQSVQVWGAQMELASTAGPYVATGANPESIGTNMTNLLPYSQQPNGPSWSNPGIQGTANAVTAPDGSMTGYQATAASGQTDAYFTNNVQNPALYDSATVTGSIFLRIPSGSLSINIYLAGENASGRTYLGSKAVQLTTAWQRFTLTGQLPNGLTRVFMQIAGAGSFTSGQTFDLWGAQLEEASTAGPYVMTSALPVTTGQELTNLLPNSQQLNGPSWGIANGSLSLNSATAPDGTTTAATLTASASSPDTFAIDNAPNPSLYDEQTVTGSVYLRVASGTLNTFLFLDNSGVSGSTAPNQPITLTTTWQRFSITATNQNGLTQLGLQIGGAGSITNGKSFQVWGPQLVVGSAAAPYIPTPAVGGTTSVVTNQSATLLQNGLDQAYSYDSFGNILENGSFNSNYTAQNRMSGFAYDAAGNLLSNGLTTMTWDAESKLISAGGATYIYDAEGNRVEKQGVGVTDTIYFGGRPLARYSAGGWTDLIYGPNGLLGEVQGTEGADTSYRFLDHLGTEVGTINSNKILINPLDYTPFGQIFSGSTNDPYLFTGLERDMESNLDHAMFRQYASTMGRWMSPDPYNGSMDFGNPQSLNRYSYVGNNPLGYTDPSGLYSLPPGNNCTICNIFDDIFSDLGSLFGGGGHSFHGSTTPRPSIKATGSYGAIQPQGDDTFTMNVSYLVPSSGVGANDLAATGAIISSLSRIMITTDNALHAPPLKVSSGVCSIYGNEPYLGAGLQCVCNSAGDSAWSQDTRGCLAADQKEGIPEFIGHGTCYTGSTIRTQNVPVTTLVGAYLSCKRW
nr:RHS repeat-associated core domain-containing protein [Granulicella arctica]